jgi:hypothetical protein
MFEPTIQRIFYRIHFLKAKINNGKYSAIIVSESTLRKRLAQARGRWGMAKFVKGDGIVYLPFLTFLKLKDDLP